MQWVVKDIKLGYLLEYAPWHIAAKPNGYVYQHRLVMERHIQRLLEPHELVHHINELKDDNRIENLEISTNICHARKHAMERYDSEIKVYHCKSCNKEFSLSTGAAKKRHGYCSPECASIAQRKCVRPDKERLAELVNKFNWCKIGRMFGVSDNAVRKWAREYDLI